MENKINIQLGAGDIILSGFINTDIARVTGIDLEVDVTKELPWPAEYADLIVCAHCLDLISDKAFVVKEIYRILKNGGWARLIFGKRFADTNMQEYADDLQALGPFTKAVVMGKFETNTGNEEVFKATGMHAPNFIIELQK